jgi:hypothetical protein
MFYYSRDIFSSNTDDFLPKSGTFLTKTPSAFGLNGLAKNNNYTH